jgi:hypothetical protein
MDYGWLLKSGLPSNRFLAGFADRELPTMSRMHTQ